MKGLATDKTYQELLAKIGDTFLISRQNAIKAINAELTKSNWETGKFIVEFEQDGNVKAKYGDELIKQLAKDLAKQLW